MNFLTDEQRLQLRDQHKHERDKKIADRIKAVLLYDKGWSMKAIAEALFISEDSVYLHIEAYKITQKLKPESGGSSEKLSIEQSKKLEEHLYEHTYLYVKDIVAYVRFTMNVSYTVPGMTNWLKRHGFSYKKPALVPGKADLQKQEKWLNDYEEKKQNLAEDEAICFIDGVHPTHNVQTAHGWIKKGLRKEIPANTGRDRLNISGSIDINSHQIVIAEDKTLNAKATILFFKKIEAAYPTKNKIYVFCDNARYYRNKEVKKYLKKSKIELIFLPPYSPNLNPIERLWKWMKERVIYNTYYSDFDDFRAAILGFFEVLKNLGPESELGQEFRRRVRDRFLLVGS